MKEGGLDHIEIDVLNKFSDIGRGSTMFHMIIIVTVCDTIWSLNGFTLAVSTHHSLTQSHNLANSHRSFHRLERAKSSDLEHQSVSLGRVSRKYIPGGRGLFSDLGKLVGDAAGVAGKAALSTFKTGHQLILPPLKGIEWLTGKATRAIGLQTNLLKNIASTVNSAWQQAKAIEFPGKSIVALVFPNRIVTIADNLTNDVMYFATKTKNAVKATAAYSLYAILKVISAAIDTAITTLGFDCIRFNKSNLPVNAGLVNSVEINGGSICGFDTLQPENNVTISKDDGKFMVITMPWVLRNLVVKIRSVDVTGFLGTMIKDQPVETIVQEIDCLGTISFQKGTFLKFVALHLELGEITGINIKVEGALEEGGVAGGIVNSLAGALGGVIKTVVNGQLVQMEKSISDYLLGNKHR